MTCLRKLWSLLQEVSDLSIETSDLYIDYETLARLRAQLREEAAAPEAPGAGASESKLTAAECARVLAVLTPSRILRLQRDRLGRVSTRALFTFAHLFSRTRKAEVDLRRLCGAPPGDGGGPGDGAGAGQLSIAQLQRFILDRASAMPVLSPLGSSMRSFSKQYARVAAQRFCFYERRADRRALNVGSVLGSPVLSEFLDLQQVNAETDPNSKALAMHYWFSIPNVKKIYNCFLVRAPGGARRRRGRRRPAQGW